MLFSVELVWVVDIGVCVCVHAKRRTGEEIIHTPTPPPRLVLGARVQWVLGGGRGGSFSSFSSFNRSLSAEGKGWIKLGTIGIFWRDHFLGVCLALLCFVHVCYCFVVVMLCVLLCVLLWCCVCDVVCFLWCFVCVCKTKPVWGKG